MADDQIEPVRVDSEMELAQSVAVRTGRDRYRTDAMVRGHPIVVDEPLAAGGGDAGPTPFDLLCTALGSCITITLRMYADRKEWPLEEVTARVEHSGRRASSSVEQTGRDTIAVEVDFRGPLDKDQRARLLEIAGRCPVSRILEKGVEIAVRAKGS